MIAPEVREQLEKLPKIWQSNNRGIGVVPYVQLSDVLAVLASLRGEKMATTYLTNRRR
jgi:hypothetical protein